MSLSYQSLCLYLLDHGVPLGSCQEKGRKRLSKRRLITIAKKLGLPHTIQQLETVDPLAAQLNMIISSDSISIPFDWIPDISFPHKTIDKQALIENISQITDIEQIEIEKQNLDKLAAQLEQSKDVYERALKNKEKEIEFLILEEKQQQALELQKQKEQQQALELQKQKEQQQALALQKQKEQQQALALQKQKEQQQALALQKQKEQQQALALQKQKEQQQVLALQKQKEQQQVLALQKQKDEAQKQKEEALALALKQKEEQAQIQLLLEKQKAEAAKKTTTSPETALAKTIEPLEEGCALSSIADLINVSTEPLTVLSVYFSCKTYNIPIRTGLKLWLKLKKENVDPLWQQYKSNPMKFLSKADYALTKVCQKQRVYESGQFNFVKALIEGGCNCACGTQMLLSLKEAYNLDSIGYATYPKHINIVNRENTSNQFMTYETTMIAVKEWVPLINYLEGKVGTLKGHEKSTEYEPEVNPTKLDDLGFTTSKMLLFAFNDFYSRTKNNEKMYAATQELFLDTPREFWSSIPLLQTIWDLSRMSEDQRLSKEKQMKLFEEIKTFINQERNAQPLGYTLSILIFSKCLVSELANFLNYVANKIILKAIHNNTIGAAKSIQNFIDHGYVIPVIVPQELLEEGKNYLACHYEKDNIKFSFLGLDFEFQTNNGKAADWEFTFTSGFKLPQKTQLKSVTRAPWRGPSDAGKLNVKVNFASGCSRIFESPWNPMVSAGQSPLTNPVAINPFQI